MQTELVIDDVDLETPMLFLVWVDTNPGDPANPDWELNSAHLCPGKSLQDALDEAAEIHKSDLETKIMPVGMTPRADGFFFNPATEP